MTDLLLWAALYLAGIWTGWAFRRRWQMWRYHDAAERLVATCEQGRAGQCSD